MKPYKECTVCFVNPTPTSPHQHIIQCSACSKSAHKFCYLPECPNDQFLCDACRNKYQGNCEICGNSGLLKQIGKYYAHPICLLFNINVLVNSYQNLTFQEIDTLKSGKKGYCQICRKESYGTLPCPYQKCPKSAHLYCTIRSSYLAHDQAWMIFFQPVNTQATRTYRENMFLRTIRSNNKFLSKHLNLKKPIKQPNSPIFVCCENHVSNVTECRCFSFDIEKSEWIQCQSCLRWEHMNCTGLSEKQAKDIQNNTIKYMCEYCKIWTDIVSEKRVFKQISKIPKLQLYDLIWIHHNLQKSKFQSNKQFLELMLSLPICPSLLYGETEMRQIFIQKLKRKVGISSIRDKIMKCQKDTNKYPKVLLDHREQIELAWWLVEAQIFTFTSVFPIPSMILEDDLIQNDQLVKMIDILIRFELKIGIKNQVFKIARQAILDKVNPFKMVKKQRQRQRTSSRNRKKQNSIQVKIQAVQSKSKSKSKTKPKVVSTTKPKNLMKQIQKSLFYSSQQQELEQQKVVKCLTFEQEFVQCLNRVSKHCEKQEPSTLIMKELLNIHKLLQKHQSAKYFNEFSKDNNFLSIIKNNSSPAKAYVMLKYGICLKRIKTQLQNCQKFSKKDIFEQYHVVKTILDKRIRVYQKICEIQEQEIKLEALNLYHEDLSINYRYYKFAFFDFDQEYEDLQNLTLKKIQSLIEVKKSNGIFTQWLVMNHQILKQISQLSFIPRQKQQVFNLLKSLPLNLKPNIAQKVLQGYLLLYDQSEAYLLSEKALINNGFCYFQRIQNIKIKQHLLNTHMKNLTKFLKNIESVPLHFFAQRIGRIIKEKVIWLINQLQQSSPFFRTEQQLDVINIYNAKFDLPQSKITQISSTDQMIQQQILLNGFDFDNPPQILALENAIKQFKDIYEELNLKFRVQKIELIQSWIDIYRYLKDELNEDINFCYKKQQQVKKQLENRQKQESLHPRADYFQIRHVVEFSQFLCFPKCNFINNLKTVLQQGSQIYKKIKKVLHSCNWEYEYGEQIDWNKKLTIETVECTLEQTKKFKLSFRVEIMQMQILIMDFKDCQRRAYNIMLDMEGKIQVISQKAGKAKLIISILGRLPFVTNYVDKLEKIIQKIEEPRSERQIKTQMCRAFIQSPYNFTFDFGFELYHYLSNQDSQLISNLQTILQLLKNMEPKFKNVLAKFNSKDITQAFKQQDIKVIQELQQQISKQTYPKDLHFDNFMLEYNKYKKVESWSNFFKEGQVKNHESLNTLVKIIETLHPSFKNQTIISIKERAQKFVLTQPNLVREMNKQGKL